MSNTNQIPISDTHHIGYPVSLCGHVNPNASTHEIAMSNLLNFGDDNGTYIPLTNWPWHEWIQQRWLLQALKTGYYFGCMQKLTLKELHDRYYGFQICRIFMGLSSGLSDQTTSLNHNYTLSMEREQTDDLDYTERINHAIMILTHTLSQPNLRPLGGLSYSD